MPNPAPAAPPAAKPEEKKPSEAGSLFRRRAGIPEPKQEKKEEKPAEKPVGKPGDAPPEKKPEAKAPAPKPKAPKKPSAAAPVTTTVDTKAIVDAIMEGNKKPEPKAVDPLEGLSDKDKRRHRVFKQMVENKTADATLPDKFVESLKKREAYQKDWESKNRGKTFNLADEEHADFVTDNDLGWDEDDYNEALAELKAKDLIEKAPKNEGLEKMEKKVEQIEREKRAEVEKPIVYHHMAVTAKVMFNELGDEFAKVLGEGGAINMDEVNRINALDPVYPEVFQMAQGVENFAGEMRRLALGHIEAELTLTPRQPGESDKQFDQRKSRVELHRSIFDYSEKQEAIFDNLPEDQKLDDRGRSFVKSDKWFKMTKAEQAKHWTLDDTTLSTLYATDMAVKAKKLIAVEEEKFSKRAAKRGYTNGNGAPNPRPKPDAKVEDKKPEAPPKPPPPSTIQPRMSQIQKTPEVEGTSLFAKRAGRK